MGFENKDSIYKELKEGQRSNGAPGEPTEAKGKMHDHAWGRHDRAAGPERWRGLQHSRACDCAVPHGRASSGVRYLTSVFRLFLGDSFVLGFDKLLN